MVLREFAKPQAARQVEARARAKRLGVRVAVVVEARSYVSASQTAPGATYRIERCRHGWSCECDGFLFTNCCKHVAAVERRAAREGWDFGTIAPVAALVTPDRQDAARAPIAPFRPRFVERERSARGRAANADLFGA